MDVVFAWVLDPHEHPRRVQMNSSEELCATLKIVKANQEAKQKQVNWPNKKKKKKKNPIS